MTLHLQVVDAFSDAPFGGNPAAVAVVEAFPPTRWMQAVAREMNLSETAFVVAGASRGSGSFALRWFTPRTEVDLCGHATLAAAHLLGGESVFETRSGPLRARSDGCGSVEMDLPGDPVRPEFPDLGGVLDEAGVVECAAGRWDLLVRLADEGLVRSCSPDLAALQRLGRRCLVVTAVADTASRSDFVSRVFCPSVGIAEDPVTGSAHCTLGAFWSTRLGKSAMVGYQASERGGTVEVRLRPDGRVVVAGRATTVADVWMHVEPPPAAQAPGGDGAPSG